MKSNIFLTSFSFMRIVLIGLLAIIGGVLTPATGQLVERVHIPEAALTVNQNIVTGAGTGSSQVKRFDTPALTESANFFAFTGFTGGVRVAIGDVNGDGIGDLITGEGPGGTPVVNVYDGSNLSLIRSFLAYPAGFTGGIFVAAGDFNGDGKADIVTGTDSGATAQVKVFDSTSLLELKNFFPFGGFTGGARVAASKINGDGIADIVVAAGPGATPQVTVFNGANLSTLYNFFAYSAGFAGGVYVAAGDVNSDLHGDIITGAGPGGGSQVNIFSGSDGLLLKSLIAFSPTYSGGVRVAAGRVNADAIADVVLGVGPNSPPQVQAYDGATSLLLQNFFAYDVAFSGGVFVAATPITTLSAAQVSISGRVTTREGRGVRNANVFMMDRNGVSLRSVTSQFGYYRFDDVPVGETYVMGVVSRRYSFTARVIDISNQLTDVDFVEGSATRMTR